MRKILIGCIADDFTGAGDIASFLEAEGLKTLLVTGVPNDPIDVDVEAVVIALKSRTEKKEKAISETMAALHFLMRLGTEKFYLKYCSTFDSTAEGNIGPVADAVMDELGIRRALICPSLLVNGRAVKDGKLYVHGVLLEDSPMKEHPLTPMKESELKKLMEVQSGYPAYSIGEGLLMGNEKELWSCIKDIEKDHSKYYLIPDYFEDKHGRRIIDLFGEDMLFTGGSGLIVPLVRSLRKRQETTNPEEKVLLLAGSCSVKTMKQIKTYIENGGETIKIDPDEVISGELSAERIWNKISGRTDVLVYSSEDQSTRLQRANPGHERLPVLLESLMAELAVQAVKDGYDAIIVAGGETSGAVTKALDVKSFRIGKSIAPGVPVLLPWSENYRLLLKSGNFGSETFFIDALAHLKALSGGLDQELNLKLKETVNLAQSLFQRGKTSGTSANISFRHAGHVYISKSGSCFGILTKEDFVKVSLDGAVIGEVKPSKELPMHLALYRNDESTMAVIHTHAFYATLWSCLSDLQEEDVIPEYTPYLKMKLGKIGLVPYEKPGSPELFEAFEKKLRKEKGYLLKNHGPVVAGQTMLQAFEGIEELEESAKIAWYLRNEREKQLGGTE